MIPEQEQVLEISELRKWFPIKKDLFHRQQRFVKAVNGVSLSIKRGEILGLVGESGCGKTTLSKLLLNIEKPTNGSIRFEGTEIGSLSGKKAREHTRKMQMIFQDPYSSLNPKMRVGNIIAEPLIIHGLADRKEAMEQTKEIMEKVGLRPDHIKRYPHEFSGGQRQRIMIAKALILNPSVVLCDEPVSALDVSIRSQILNLLKDLQKDFNLTYLFISHDLSVVEYMCNRIAVMYLGQIVEIAGRDDLYENPLHPYTKALLSGLPVPDPDYKKERIILKGDVPSPVDPPDSCLFAPRCWLSVEGCDGRQSLQEAENGHFVACIRHAVNMKK